MYQAPPGRPVSSPPATDMPVVTGARVKFKPSKHRRGWTRISDMEREGILALGRKGLSSAVIAKKFNRSQPTIAMILRAGLSEERERMGYPMKKPGESNPHYGHRVQQWMLKNSPGFRARQGKAISRGKKKSAAKIVGAKPAAPTPQPVPRYDFLEPLPPVQPTLWQRISKFFGF